ncbi:MAG: PPC domain-containing protein [Phycisphaerales bacterium]|nr:PPC domain-containing protein [Phycisphaerales bacterium]MCB9854545.1 PPC domain-containing protein [Phycisphaerales bacterium]MCB9863200.1 PPC domain-containing protein [Phycisphaerales bacterium]
MNYRQAFILACTLALSLLAASTEAAAPELLAVFPTGVQRGTNFELSLQGNRLADAEEILFYRPGIQVESIVAEDKTVTAKCSIDASCRLGELPLRIRTRSGMTELRTLFVGALPVLPETEPNNAIDAAQAISLDITIDGRITREDIDYFVVEAKAGERITAEIEAIRLGRTMFDPYVAILDSNRFELSASDDSVLLLQDSIASAVAPQDGRYYVLVRDASFQGDDASFYRLHVGRFPRPRVAFPPGGQPGQITKLQLRGDVAGEIDREVQLPAAPTSAWPVDVEDSAGVTPSPVWLRIGNEAVVNEIETSDGSRRPENANPPIAFQGVLSQPGETDEWTFSATKDQALAIRVVAREIRSPIDSVIDVLGPDGAVISSNDDARGPDSEVAFTAPADGGFRIRLRDHLGRGGPLFIYRIEIAPREPAIRVSMDVMDKRRPQFLQTIDVPRGNRFAGLFRVTRENVGGPVNLSITDLPNGIAASLIQLDKDETLLPVVFEATADGQTAGALCSLFANINSGGGVLTGAFEQPIPLVIGPPNEQVYYATSVDRLAVALTESVPFRIDVDPLPAPLLRDGAANLHVKLVRDEGFDAEVETRMLWSPGGVASAGSIKIPPQATSAEYPINANGDAPLRTQQLVVLARAQVAGADRWTSSAPIPLEIGDRFVTGELKMCVIQCGQSSAIVCSLKHVRPFEGAGTLDLLGLPPGVSTEPVQVTPGQTDAVFTLTAAEDAPIGRRGGLFCQFTTQVNGVSSMHRLAGGGVIRIDAKPVEIVKAAPAPQPAPVAEAKPAPPKPLSRLQQLRKEAEQRRNAETKSQVKEEGK